jgi:hypothetical protein
MCLSVVWSMTKGKILSADTNPSPHRDFAPTVVCALRPGAEQERTKTTHPAGPSNLYIRGVLYLMAD